MTVYLPLSFVVIYAEQQEDTGQRDAGWRWIGTVRSGKGVNSFGSRGFSFLSLSICIHVGVNIRVRTVCGRVSSSRC